MFFKSSALSACCLTTVTLHHFLSILHSCGSLNSQYSSMVLATAVSPVKKKFSFLNLLNNSHSFREAFSDLSASSYSLVMSLVIIRNAINYINYHDLSNVYLKFVSQLNYRFLEKRSCVHLFIVAVFTQYSAQKMFSEKSIQ